MEYQDQSKTFDNRTNKYANYVHQKNTTFYCTDKNLA